MRQVYHALVHLDTALQGAATFKGNWSRLNARQIEKICAIHHCRCRDTDAPDDSRKGICEQVSLILLGSVVVYSCQSSTTYRSVSPLLGAAESATSSGSPRRPADFCPTHGYVVWFNIQLSSSSLCSNTAQKISCRVHLCTQRMSACLLTRVHPVDLLPTLSNHFAVG